MQTYIPLAGEHIHTAATNAVLLAQQHGEPCRFTFNDVTVTVLPTETPSQAVDVWRTTMEAKAAAYRNSPEGKRAAAEREAAERRNRERAGERKAFPLHAVLTLATGRVWGDFGEAHEAAEWLMGRPVWTHEFAYSGDQIRALAKAAAPALATVTADQCPTSPDDCDAKLAAMVALYGATVEIPCGTGD